jgi:hypothetical protein
MDPTKNRRVEIQVYPRKDIPKLETNAGKEVAEKKNINQ